MNSLLNKIYYDEKHPGSYSSPAALFKEACKYNGDVTLTDVKRFLQDQVTYTLHKQVRKKWKRNPVVASHVNELFQADLVEMIPFARANNGNRYIVTVVDVLSKYAFAVPIKRKLGKDVRDALEIIFKERVPAKLMTDKGKEFVNKEVQELLKKLDVQYYTSTNPKIKCSNVERFNRTLRNKMHKVFTAKGTRKYVHILPNLISTYNNTLHRTIKMKPIDVTDKNQNVAFQNLYKFSSKREMLKAFTRQKTVKLSLGDTVRLPALDNVFQKSYWPGWQDAAYKIAVINRNQSRQLIKVDNNKRRYYKEEIQKISSNPEFRIEKILKKRVQNGITQYYCKFLNYNSEGNTWIDANSIRNLNGSDN